MWLQWSRNWFSSLFAAAALGITSLERHITLDRAMYGSDRSFFGSYGVKKLVGEIKNIFSFR